MTSLSHTQQETQETSMQGYEISSHIRLTTDPLTVEKESSLISSEAFVYRLCIIPAMHMWKHTSDPVMWECKWKIQPSVLTENNNTTEEFKAFLLWKILQSSGAQ